MDLTNYLELRIQIKTGDLLAFSGRGIISNIIKWRTKSHFTHVAMLVRLHEGADRLFLLHAVAKHGVVLLPASRYLSQHHGRAWWVALKEPTPGIREAMLREALLALGKPYDWRGVIRFVLPFVKQQNGAYFCSELAADLRLKHGLADETQLSPAQIVEHPVNAVPVELS